MFNKYKKEKFKNIKLIQSVMYILSYSSMIIPVFKSYIFLCGFDCRNINIFVKIYTWVIKEQNYENTVSLGKVYYEINMLKKILYFFLAYIYKTVQRTFSFLIMIPMVYGVTKTRIPYTPFHRCIVTPFHRDRMSYLVLNVACQSNSRKLLFGHCWHNWRPVIC